MGVIFGVLFLSFIIAWTIMTLFSKKYVTKLHFSYHILLLVLVLIVLNQRNGWFNILSAFILANALYFSIWAFINKNNDIQIKLNILALLFIIPYVLNIVGFNFIGMYFEPNDKFYLKQAKLNLTLEIIETKK